MSENISIFGNQEIKVQPKKKKKKSTVNCYFSPVKSDHNYHHAVVIILYRAPGSTTHISGVNWVSFFPHCSTSWIYKHKSSYNSLEKTSFFRLWDRSQLNLTTYSPAADKCNLYFWLKDILSSMLPECCNYPAYICMADLRCVVGDKQSFASIFL